MNPPLNITPTQGLGTILLGASPDSAHSEMKAIDSAAHYYEPTLSIYSEVLGGQLQFTKAAPSSLYQIVAGKTAVLVAGEQIIGERLEDALVKLGVKQWSDTLWSIVGLDTELVGGVPRDDRTRPRKATAKELLAGGTLWIKSLGLGLVMKFGRVELVCVRTPADVPKVGCGELSEQQLLEQVAPERFPSIPRSAPLPKRGPNPPKKKLWRRVIFSLLAIGFMTFPAIVVYRDITAWQQAMVITGTVVETRPEGPFPDELDVQYEAAGGASHTITLGSAYTTARAKGDKVELLYRPEMPHQAMTRIKIQEDGWSIHPYALFGSVLCATFCLVAAFPEYIRLQDRRP